MREHTEILKDLHARLTVSAELQGEDCPSFESVERGVQDAFRHSSYGYEFGSEQIGKWLETAPAPDSEEYARMREAYISQAVETVLRYCKLPSRHALQIVVHTNKEWAAAFQKACKRMVENEDCMLALLGPRGTGKTQMAVELIRFMVRHTVEDEVKPASGLEQWGWKRSGLFPLPWAKRFSLYSNTMGFFLQLRKTYQSDSEEHEDDVLGDFVNPSLLILDEAHDRRGSDWENQMFTHLIDRRYQAANKWTVFIANQTAQEFEENVGSSIADRLQECGGIVSCNWKSFRSGK